MISTCFLVPILRVLCFTIILSEVQTASSDDFSSKVDTLAETLMKQLRIPGLALSVVKNGEVIKSSGYGYRNIDTKEPVTNETLYSIGSVTKSFTALLVLKHFTERNISLEDPIQKYLGDKAPQFSDISEDERKASKLIISNNIMLERYRTNHMSIRDLITHRTGIAVAPMPLLTESIPDRNDYVSRIKYFPEVKPLRTSYEYDNDMYLLTGWILEQITGKPWEQLVKEDILQPLGMKSSMLAAELADKFKELNAAISYNRNDTESDVLNPIDMDTMRRVEPFNPAGGIISNANDMAKYVECYLSNGEEVLPKNLIQEMYISGNPIKQRIQLGANYSEVFYGYGLGLIPGIVKGYDMIVHDGGWNRQSSSIRMYPGLNIGIFSVVQDPDQVAGAILNAMLQNGIFMILTEGNYMPELFAYTDLFLNQTYTALAAARSTYFKSGDQFTSNIKTELPLSSFVGTYGNLINGNFTISISSEDSNCLNATLGWLSGTLTQVTKNVTSKGIFEMDYSTCAMYFDLQPIKVFVIFGATSDDSIVVQSAYLALQNAVIDFERDLKFPDPSVLTDDH